MKEYVKAFAEDARKWIMNESDLPDNQKMLRCQKIDKILAKCDNDLKTSADKDLTNMSAVGKISEVLRSAVVC